MYCKFGNFRENLFSRIAIKDIYAMFKLRDLGFIYIAISVNDSDFVISRGFNFHYAKFRENITLAIISEFTVLF